MCSMCLHVSPLLLCPVPSLTTALNTVNSIHTHPTPGKKSGCTQFPRCLLAREGGDSRQLRVLGAVLHRGHGGKAEKQQEAEAYSLIFWSRKKREEIKGTYKHCHKERNFGKLKEKTRSMRKKKRSSERTWKKINTMSRTERQCCLPLQGSKQSLRVQKQTTVYVTGSKGKWGC